MAELPEWLDRLRTAVFVSPSGVEISAKVDVLTRIGGKKVSNHEILNRNESIPQDQGNKARRYPLDFYFTGDSGDQEADEFFEALHEPYTVKKPGTLRHPTWGDIPVMPFSDPQQTHNLVNGGGIFRVAIEFITVPQNDFPTPEGIDQSEIVSDIDNLEETLAEANAGIDIEDAGRFAEFRSTVNNLVGIISNSLESVASGVSNIEDQFRQIQDDIDNVLQIGGDAVEILSQVNNLIRLPGQILDSTLNKVQSYASMSEGIFNSFVGFFNPNADRISQINEALTAQNTYGMASAALAEASLFTDFETRDQAADVLDAINLTDDNYKNGVSGIAQILTDGVAGSFNPDHNAGLGLSLLIGKTNSILLDRSFSLKARRDYVLPYPTDPITETWNNYESVSNEDIDFFIRTNNLNDVEMIEIPAGRYLVVYV